LDALRIDIPKKKINGLGGLWGRLFTFLDLSLNCIIGFCQKLLKVFSPSGMTTITYIAGQGRVCNNLNH
jgi:hypothetical protein